MAFDQTNPAHLAALKAEVTVNPLGLPYVPSSTQEGILDVINLKNPAYIVSKPKIAPAQVKKTTTLNAYNEAPADKQDWLRWMTEGGSEEEIMYVTSDLRLRLAGDPTPAASIWGINNRVEMNAAMKALMDVPGSRAEVLFGFNTIISKSDWIAARDS